METSFESSDGTLEITSLGYPYYKGKTLNVPHTPFSVMLMLVKGGNITSKTYSDELEYFSEAIEKVDESTGLKAYETFMDGDFIEIFEGEDLNDVPKLIMEMVQKEFSTELGGYAMLSEYFNITFAVYNSKPFSKPFYDVYNVKASLKFYLFEDSDGVYPILKQDFDGHVQIYFDKYV